MIEAIAMSGVYDPKTGKINYKNSTDQEVDWFRICVNQGHMARVIQDTTQPGTTLARSLFSEACELGLKKDPSTGVLFVPASRMTTPGYKLN